jgi:hypothetical protein
MENQIKEVISQSKYEMLDDCKESLQTYYGDSGKMYAHISGVMSALLTPSQVVELTDSVQRFIKEAQQLKTK